MKITKSQSLKDIKKLVAAEKEKQKKSKKTVIAYEKGRRRTLFKYSKQ